MLPTLNLPSTVAKPHPFYDRPVELSDEDYEDGMTEEEIKEWLEQEVIWQDNALLQKKTKANVLIPSITPSQFTEFAFRMPAADGMGYENFSFKGRRHMRRIYDTPARRILLMCARQTEKSTTLGNRTLCYSCLVPSFKTLYVSPSATQTKTFSSDRIKEPIETSPVLRAYTTQMLSQNVFEKQFVNRAKITLRYAFLNADRCVVGATRVHFTDGSVATVEEVFRNQSQFVGRSVWAANRSNVSIQPAVLTGAVEQGIREVFNVRLMGGAEFRCTHNQPLLTWDGWKTLDQLKPGDFVAVPQQAPHGSGLAVPVEEFRFVGYLLGDGSVKTMNVCALHNSNQKVLKDFRRCARVLKVKLWRERDNNPKHWINVKTKKQGFGGGSTGYKKRLVELGVIGKDHLTKRVPLQFFEGDKAQISAFLQALFATDGWASVSAGNQYEIGYCSNSKGLLMDVRQLLLRFGIHSFISRQKKPSTAKALGAYTLSIRHHDSVLVFVAEIGIIGKEVALSEVAELARKVARHKNDYDRIPMPYRELKDYLKNRYGLSTHRAWMKHHIQLRPGNRKDSIGRKVLFTIGSKLGDTWLLHLAKSSLGWARIEEITSSGKEPTFDLSIDQLENYLSDGVFVHNTRGIPSWALMIDELQDILQDNIPVIEQCTSHAPERWKTFIYAGTPKSLDNTIEYYRSSLSTQGEWVVPCDCSGGETGRYWNILGEKNIGKKSLICERCGHELFPQREESQWANMIEKADFESYRIPQLMVPWRSWDEILLDYKRYPRDRFYNEVLGISFDSGMRPLTQADVKNACDERVSMHPTHLKSYQQKSLSQDIFCGIDWGGGDSGNSYTVLTLATYVENKFRIFYIHRFVGEDLDPNPQLEKIMDILRTFNVAVCGVDWGGGFYPSDTLVRKFGPHRIQKFQYMARVRKKVDMEPRLRRFKVHRTEVMSDIFNAIKRREIVLPRWEEFKEPYAQDLLNIFSEYNESMHMIQYNHSPGKPDDSFHSILYCFLASMLKVPRPDVIAPIKEDPTRGGLRSTYTGNVDQG